MTQWTAHCGCTITCDDADGEPVEFISRCPIHQSAEPADVAMENRAMSLAREAVAQAAGISPTDVVVTLDQDTRAATATAEGYTATVPKVSLQDFVARIEKAGTLAARV